MLCSLLLCASSHLVSGVSLFFFQAEDGIRDLVRSRGLGDVYKRQRFGLCGPNITDDITVATAKTTPMAKTINIGM